MKLLKSLSFLLAITVFVPACQNSGSTGGSADSGSETANNPAPAEPEMTGQDTNVDMQMVANLRNALKFDLLKDDLANIPAENRRFSFAEADLTGDEKDEYLVGMQNAYFCGTGGCTFMLLDHEGTLITQFSVSRAPFYVMPQKTNGMNDLLVYSNGSMRKLVFDGKSYPSNPSMEEVYNEAPDPSWPKLLEGKGQDPTFEF